MHIDRLGGVILTAWGVCVLAVVVALLLPHISSGRNPFSRYANGSIVCRVRPILARAGNWRTRKANYALATAFVVREP
jgi:hypothetical protein